MEDGNNEKYAQLHYEHMKLQDELKQLQKHALFIEESYSSLLSVSNEKDNNIKSLEQQLNSTFEALKESKHLIEVLSSDNEKYMKLNNDLRSENYSLRRELKEEHEMMKIEAEESRLSYIKIKEENDRLLTELNYRANESFFDESVVRDLMQKNKELENEKLELLLQNENLQYRLTTQEAEKTVQIKNSLVLEEDWSPDKLHMNDYRQDDMFGKEENLNLQEEILQVEVEEKTNLISSLTNSLMKMYEDNVRLTTSLKEMKVELEKLKEKAQNQNLSATFYTSLTKTKPTNARPPIIVNFDDKLKQWSLLIYQDVTRDKNSFYACPSFYGNDNTVPKNFIIWPGGQSEEIGNLTEVTSLSIVAKDGVQTLQPGPIYVSGTISIASQTDPIKNLSPVLPFKGFQEPTSPPDSDEEVSHSPFIEKLEIGKSTKVFSEHKNCDLDMDLFRSCRKLSVLPEEDNDECFNKKCFKISAKSNSGLSNLKTHSADDLFKFKKWDSPSEEMSASMMAIPRSLSSSMSKVRLLPFVSDVNSRDVELPGPRSENHSEVRFSQPYTLDSYLVPETHNNSILDRQTSYPMQNITFAPSNRPRGIQNQAPKSRSTCRPLRLPCEKEVIKRKDDRICKVRFDLSEIESKNRECRNATDTKCRKPLSNLKNNKPCRMVARFRVETVDETEFRKALAIDSQTVPRKRPPHLVKQSSLRDSTDFDLETETKREIKLAENLPEERNNEVFTGVPQVTSANKTTEFTNEMCPSKKRRQSEPVSNAETVRNNDILMKSIQLHTDSQCILMKDLKTQSSSFESSGSEEDIDIPYIDAEDLPVLKPASETVEIFPSLSPKEPMVPPRMSSPVKNSPAPSVLLPSLSGTEATLPCPVKYTGLSKSPTVLKNLVNFELLTSIFGKEECWDEKHDESSHHDGISSEKTSGNTKCPSMDVSEASESDTLTYDTVRSQLFPSSDCDSDTYVTVYSDRSSLFERKFSDFSENSSSPYNTPPEMSSAGFYTPPDTYSPILNVLKKHSCPTVTDTSGSAIRLSFDGGVDDFLEDCQRTITAEDSKTCNASSNYHQPPTGESKSTTSVDETNFSSYKMIFDSPKLEFYEPNDSVENLENFLLTEEGLSDQKFNRLCKALSPSLGNLDRLIDSRCSGDEDGADGSRGYPPRRDGVDGPDSSFFERRGRRQPFSKQNSCEDYNFLDPHDSCLNLSEEISSPSTTPDTSNKTVIFNKIPLTVSNTIDLEDEDDFPTSETEVQNVNEDADTLFKTVENDGPKYLSRPESRSSDSGSFEGLQEAVAPAEIGPSNLSSDSDKSEFDGVCLDLPSNAEDLSDDSNELLADSSCCNPSENGASASPEKIPACGRSKEGQSDSETESSAGILVEIPVSDTSGKSNRMFELTCSELEESSD